MTNLKYDYSRSTDEELVELSKKDNIAVETLMLRYIEFIKLRVNSYYINGGDKDDLIQEGMIGLFKAIRDYKLDKNVPFKVFATLCINRNLFTSIKTANRQKHKFNNECVSIYKEIYEDSNIKIIDLLSDINSCEENILYFEEYKMLKKAISETLTELESKAIIMHYEGYSYNEVASILGRNYKSIDAAINRAKIKLRKKLDISEFRMMI